MELRDAIRSRRMIRSYDPDQPIPREVLEELLELAVFAPSAGYTQGWHFLVLDDITSIRTFWSVTTETGPTDSPDGWLRRLQTAPALIVCLSDKQAYLDRYAEPDKGWTDRAEAHWPVPYWDVDAGMAALLMLLGATDRGLASCLFGVPGERWDALRNAFGVPERMRPVGVVSLGHPAPDVRSPSLRRGRRAYSDVVSWGGFSGAASSTP
ncbi:MAG TPA: nitroreductase family protein [Jatrophihabitans sp.]|jgi:nitroreductase